jgi:regulatory protein
VPVRGKKPGDGAGKPAPSTLPYEEQLEKAREAALRLLAVRERSTVELRSRLRQKGFGPDVIVAVVERLQETELQSDSRFGAQFVESATRRGLGTRRIQTELRARGLSKEEAARAATEDPEVELARARELAERKAARMEDLPMETRVRRLLSLLARKGFDPDICRIVAKEAAGSPSLDPLVDRDLP